MNAEINFSIRAAIHDRYRPPEWAILFEVRNTTGFSRLIRSADAIAMSLYPSRGLELIGFEFKRSRSDWLNELRNPDKSCAIQRYCDRWMLAVSDEKIVQPGELPATWGLLVPRGKKFACKVEGERLKGEPIDRNFLASIMRNIHTGSVDKKAIDAAAAIVVEKETLRCRELHEVELLRRERQFNDLKSEVVTFENASGVKINNWDARAVGEAVRFVLAGGVETRRRELERLLSDATSIRDYIARVLQK